MIAISENISGSWQYSASQLQICENKLQECFQGIDELNVELDEKEGIYIIWSYNINITWLYIVYYLLYKVLFYLLYTL